MFIKQYPYIVATVFSIMFVALSINPVDRDAQKDTLADTLGAIFSLALFWLIRPDTTKEER